MLRFGITLKWRDRCTKLLVKPFVVSKSLDPVKMNLMREHVPFMLKKKAIEVASHIRLAFTELHDRSASFSDGNDTIHTSFITNRTVGHQRHLSDAYFRTKYRRLIRFPKSGSNVSVQGHAVRLGHGSAGFHVNGERI